MQKYPGNQFYEKFEVLVLVNVLCGLYR